MGKKLLAYLKKSSIKNALLSSEVDKGELCLVVAPENIVSVMTFLRDDIKCVFKVLVDLCGADYPKKPKRFEVVYNLLSMVHNMRIRVKVCVDEDEMVPSVVPIFSTATWFEREVWDMYGVPFSGNPDLRRLLTDYGFSGHPLRKDFPLTGYVEVRYSDEEKRVVYEPVSLLQDFRKFDFVSPCEGVSDVLLPGDEKANIQKYGTDFLKDE